MTESAARSPLPVDTALVVSADADARAAYGAALAAIAATIHEAEDGAEALGKALACRPGLVVTDMALRRIDSVSLVMLLRQESATRSCRIVVLTADEDSAAVARAMNAGADVVVLANPVSGAALARAVLQIIPPVDTTSASSTQLRGGRRNRGAARLSQSHAHQRYKTTDPPHVPPALHCPSCLKRLEYVNSHVGGVSDHFAEQWDHYVCSRCGRYQYRQRTHKLTREP